MSRILIIEDNPASLELMRYLLKMSGHEVHAADDGAAGLEAARQLLPDLIICDVRLPKIDGYEVVRCLKADPGFRDVPVIAVTAQAMLGDRERGLAAGFDGYLYKPIEPETFVVEVERFLLAAGRAAPDCG